MTKPPSFSDIEMDFLSDAEALKRKAIPPWIGWTLYILGAATIGAIVWSAVTQLDVLVIARGKLTTTPASLVVQPLETGVVRTIDVVVGQTVRPGQTLVTLDSTFAAADLAQMANKQASLTWQAMRLSALLADQATLPVPPNDDVGRLQSLMLAQQQAGYRAQVVQHDAEIQRLTAQVANSRAAVELLRQRLGTLEEIVRIHQQLKSSEGGSRYKLLSSLDSYQGVVVELQREINRSADMERQIVVEKAQRDSWIQDWRQKLTAELQAVQRELDESTRQLEKAQRRAHLIALTAPVSAIVLDLAPRSVGSVVKEAEPMVTLVPLDTPLKAEVEIADRDIGYVRVGQPANIKVDAFPFQKHGILAATLDTISADAFVKERGTDPVVYRARLLLASQTLADPASRLLPGATIQSEIVVGHRSILSYALYPLLKSLENGGVTP